MAITIPNTVTGTLLNLLEGKENYCIIHQLFINAVVYNGMLPLSVSQTVGSM